MISATPTMSTNTAIVIRRTDEPVPGAPALLTASFLARGARVFARASGANTKGTPVTDFGYTLSSEEHPPSELVRNARRAEELGFDFASISDHYHPWVSAQGHSPFVWSVLGAIAASTDRLQVGIGVTCPIVRVHPAVIAQAAATTSLLFEGRFFLGLGTG